MNYFGKIISNISQAYSEINPATLTGAIDVIVVEQEDGTLLTSPFHVRFGKMGVIRSREKIVDIEINGQPIDIHMKLGNDGEAYFIEECDEDDDDDDDDDDDETMVQDFLKNDDSLSDERPLDLSITGNHRSEDGLTSKSIESREHSMVKSESLPSGQKRTRRKKKCKSGHSKQLSNADSSLINENQSVDLSGTATIDDPVLKPSYSDTDLHPYSDSEADTKKQKESVTQKNVDYKSDSEVEIINNKLNEKPQQDNISWGWGELPNVKKDEKQPQSVLGGMLNFMIKDKEKTEDDKGIYLDDIDPSKPEDADRYLVKSREFRTSLGSRPNAHTTSTSSDDESGKGASVTNSPLSGVPHDYQCPRAELAELAEHLVPGDLYNLSRTYHDMSMSLCGKVEDLIANPQNTERFLQSIVSFDDFAENPLQILENPNLVVRMGSNYYPWKMAAAIIFSLLLYQRPLSEKTMSMLKDKCVPKKASPQSSRGWRSWWRTSPTENNNKGPTNMTTAKNNENNIDSPVETPTGENKPFPSSGSFEKAKSTLDYISDEETLSSVVITNNSRNSIPKSDSNTNSNKKMKYKKVLRLGSDALKSFNLRKGSNDVMFSVTTAYQGTTACKSKIYLWGCHDKIIISDIDGTITKSDVLGHILPSIPLLGSDWAQLGVTKLYTKIQKNGYKFLYLSARAIGQAKSTRDYLCSINQEGELLPDGPLLLSPTSLFSALHREVIEKKPEEFKIGCLKDIQSLFKENPFYAGFGNKINDTWAYKAVGIDSSRIFLVNHKGELKLDKIISFKSSYSDLCQFVDQMFPPLHGDQKNQDPNTDDYSLFMYWRTDIPVLEDKDVLVK